MKTNYLIFGGLAIAAVVAGVIIYKKRQEADEAADALVLEKTIQDTKDQVTSEIKTAQDEALKKTNAWVLKKYPAGTTIRISGQSSVYIINEFGQRQWISSRALFDKLKLNLADVQSITKIEMGAIPLSTALAGLRSINDLLF